EHNEHEKSDNDEKDKRDERLKTQETCASGDDQSSGGQVTKARCFQYATYLRGGIYLNDIAVGDGSNKRSASHLHCQAWHRFAFSVFSLNPEVPNDDCPRAATGADLFGALPEARYCSFDQFGPRDLLVLRHPLSLPSIAKPLRRPPRIKEDPELYVRFSRDARSESREVFPDSPAPAMAPQK